jgi:hypothetical protein
MGVGRAGTTSDRADQRAWLEALFVLSDLTTRILAALGSNLFMGFVIAAGATGLVQFAFDVTRPEPVLDSAQGLEDVAEGRFEVQRIWLPKTLVELARSPSRHEVTRTHGEFQRFLERRHEERLWYAYATRVYQRNGKFSDCAYIRQPYRDEFLFSELCGFLAGVAGPPPHFEAEEFENVSIAVIPDELLTRDSQAAGARLLENLHDPADSWPSP